MLRASSFPKLARKLTNSSALDKHFHNHARKSIRKQIIGGTRPSIVFNHLYAPAVWINKRNFSEITAESTASSFSWPNDPQSPFWASVENRKRFFEEIGKQLGVKELSDWYNIPVKELTQRGGTGAVLPHRGYLCLALSQLFPDYPWQIWRFEVTPNEFWADTNNHRIYLDWVFKELGLQTWEDWYTIKPSKVLEKRGHQLWYYYKGSLIKAIMSTYPEHPWEIKKFAYQEKAPAFKPYLVPRGCWGNMHHQREFLKSIEKEFQLSTPQDWTRMKHSDILNYGGRGLLEIHGSLFNALKAVYPNVAWDTVFESKGSTQKWGDFTSVKDFIEKIGREQGITSPEDWYKANLNQLSKSLPSQLLKKYDGSLFNILKAVYPTVQWEIWKFNDVPKRHWEAEENEENFIKWIENKGYIQKPDDWLVVSTTLLRKLGGGKLLDKYGSLKMLLSTVRPNVNWDDVFIEKKVIWNRPQSDMLIALKELFVAEPTETNYVVPEIVDNEKNLMPLQVYLPVKKLAFDYRAEENYHFHWLYGSPEKQQAKNQLKKQLCSEFGITLIEIPYWWDRTKSSLEATIHAHRADLFPNTFGTAIPGQPQVVRRTGVTKTHDVPFMIPTKWTWDQSPNGWWISKAIDGLRARWYDGAFCLVNGNEILPSESFKKGTSALLLDGVLYAENGNHWKLLTDYDNQSNWEGVKYYVIDAPTRKDTYEKRIEFLKSYPLPDHMPILEITQCEGENHLKTVLNDAVSKGHSGVFLRQPRSFYQTELAPVLKKVEPKDTLTAVVREANGSSLTCALPSGIKFEVTGEAQEGNIIILTHSGISSEGVPQSPVFERVRPDLTWETILKYEYPYQVQITKVQRQWKCAGCKKTQPGTKQVKVVVKGFYLPSKQTGDPHSNTYSLCMNKECINKFYEEQSKQTGHQIPEFYGKVFLPEKIRSFVDEAAIKESNNIEFVRE